MALKKIAGSIFFLIIALGVTSASIPLTVNSGEVMLKKGADTAWAVFDTTSVIESGDILTVGKSSETECTLLNSVKLLLKDSCEFIINANENKCSLVLNKGQMFLHKDSAAVEVVVEIKARGCIFTPIGTAAAVKITKKGDPSVAVLQGTIRMTKPDGASIDVGAGMYSSFNVAGGTFTSVRQLPPKAVASLESWTNVKLAQPAPKEEAQAPEESPAVEATPKPQITETPAVAEVEKEPAAEPEKEVEEKETADQVQPPLAGGEKKQGEETAKKEEKEADKEKPEKEKRDPDKPQWEISAAMVTVDNEQWTRIAVGVDVPIWRFGVFFDLELFLDAQGNFSNKGWDFSSGRNTAESLLRKIRYIRFNHPGDPVFIKFGGLDNVSFCYGFVVDRFTNMLNYPGEKLFGLQFDLNDLSPIGLSLQTLIPDFKDFGNDGGILAARLAFKPLKMTDKPIIGGLTIGATVASDLNQYAPARQWDYTLNGDEFDKDEDGIVDGDWLDTWFKTATGDSLSQTDKHILSGQNLYDDSVQHKDHWAEDSTDPAIILGGDIIIPIISSKLLNLDLYAQTGVMVDDGNDDQFYKGWGIGAPGIGLKVGPFWSRLEYRHVEDIFEIGYFGTYYLDERIRRTPNVHVKEDSLPSVDLDGVFGMCGFNIKNILILSGSYQRLCGKEKSGVLDQRAEGEASLGDVLLERIPKINKVSFFYYQTKIDKKKKRPFFYQSPYTYWGYRLGCEVVAGASIIWETRYGWKWNSDGNKLVDDKTMTIQAALIF